MPSNFIVGGIDITLCIIIMSNVYCVQPQITGVITRDKCFGTWQWVFFAIWKRQHPLFQSCPPKLLWLIMAVRWFDVQVAPEWKLCSISSLTMASISMQCQTWASTSTVNQHAELKEDSTTVASMFWLTRKVQTANENNNVDVIEKRRNMHTAVLARIESSYVLWIESWQCEWFIWQTKSKYL